MQKASVHIGQRNTKHERVPMITNDYNLLCRTALSFTRRVCKAGIGLIFPMALMY